MPVFAYCDCNRVSGYISVPVVYLVWRRVYHFRRSVCGAYVVLSGACQRIEQTAIRRRTKVIYFTVSPHTVRVNLKRWVKDLAEGDGIVLYVADNTPVYEKDGCQVLNGYLALEIRKGSDGDE